MPSVRTRVKKSSALTQVPDDAFARALKRIKGMTKAERINSLKEAGILTRKGKYTKPYRVLVSKVAAV